MAKTKRSHPPSLRHQVKKSLIQNLPKHSHILLGVSGGSDSMALMHVLAGLREELNFKLSVVSINHGLRVEAYDEVNLVKSFAEQLNVDFYSKEINLGSGGNIQERAREARYNIFNSLMIEVGANFIATAHHRNDKAETILMRILTGTKVSGLNVLQERFNHVLRPMVMAYKSDVMLHIERKNIPYMDDPSNKYVDKYFRSKVRYELIPELQKINPNVVDALCNLSDDAVKVIV
jgi:tRNA(Ile)-lysidine synthase